MPGAIQDRVGRAEIHRSLRTTCPREAIRRAKRAWLAIEGFFQIMSRNPALQAAQAKVLVDQLLSEPLFDSPTADELVEAMLRGDWTYGKQMFTRAAVDQVMALEPDDRDKVGRQMVRIADRTELELVRRRAEREGIFTEAALLQAAQAEERASVAEAALRDATVATEVARRLGELTVVGSRPATAVTEAEPAAEPVPPGKAKQKQARFSELTGPYIVDRTRGGKGFTGQTKAQVDATFRLWLQLVGDGPAASFTGKHAGEFRDLLLRIPSNHGKGARQHAMEAIRRADRKEALGTPVPRLTMKTVKRHFSALSQLWKWMQPRTHATTNIFRGFDFPGTTSKKQLRDDWSEADLLLLFDSDWYGPGVAPDSAQRWLPVIAMFSGMRLEEMSRLRPDLDIVEIGDIPAFKVQEHKGPEAWTPKTEAGERDVPIHPVLLELGLMEMVKRRRAEGARRLFPELRPTGPDRKLSTEYSRRFGRARTKCGIGSKTVFHSFRHSVRTVLGNTDAKETWIDALLGHEGDAKSVGVSVYQKRVIIQNLKEIVDRIAYPTAVTTAVRAAMAACRAPVPSRRE